MKNSLALVKENKTVDPKRNGRIWRETPITNDIMFHGKDACGRSGWFLRLTVSGLYPRRVGPYRTKTDALDALEEFVSDVDAEAFLNMMNAVKDQQVVVVEGVPTLNGR